MKSRAENVMIYFLYSSGICCLLMPQVLDFQYKAWLLHRREIGTYVPTYYFVDSQ